MGSASEDIQDQSGDARSKTTRSTGNSSSLDVGLQSVSSVLQKDQVVSEDDYAPKVRKPYTISKQRERWTEEEHNKFLEALKLYGRAWRRIEEHVGTKTAVQIRSHAQKFFSKVVRESSSNEESIVKPIEIPPPRPKRKPAHPYPRKMVSPVKTGSCLLDELKRSASPNLSISGQENQSPTSVLSRVGSDVTDSNMPNGSLSPVSSPPDDQPVGLFPCETVPPPEDNSSENGMSSPSQENDGFTQDEEVLPKLELFPEDIAFVKERSNEVASTQRLKLFGKTVIIKGSSSPNWANFNSQPPEETDERPVQTSWNLAPGECAWNDLPCGSPALYYMQFPNGNSNTLEVGSASLPRWTFNGEVSYPFLQLHNPIPDKEHVYSDGNEGQGFQNDGSRVGSDNRSVNTGGDDEKTWDVEPQSHQSPFDEEENEPGLTFGFKPRNELPEKKKNGDKSLKGFVPYKRSLANRDNSATSIVEEREERRIRLCL